MEPDSIPGLIIWYSIFIAIYSIGFSVISVIMLKIYYRNTTDAIYKSVKKEILLLIYTILLFVVFIFSNWMIHENS